ncbi:NifU family protein [Patescibacteria group bacterium]|jgi:Fe-S cluster biogenesis protein NfuA|nr:NifU family protein [Patescibacteria group bacterium]HPD07727.1 NifU family protein [bacterium]HRT11051.1 NifU family protein [Patescibacteria group bacterium]HRU89750.1 NifU family protein [Patescibacteria group bacterium]
MIDIKKISWWPELEKIIAQEIRPSLQLDGGDIKLVDFDPTTGVLRVELQGHCAHCPMMELTLKEGIEAELITRLPEIKQVVVI